MVEIEGKYSVMCRVLERQRRKMIHDVGVVNVYCLACGAMFTIDDWTDDILYCRPEHRRRHGSACGDGAIAIMDFEGEEDR